MKFIHFYCRPDESLKCFDGSILGVTNNLKDCSEYLEKNQMNCEGFETLGIDDFIEDVFMCSKCGNDQPQP